MDGSLFLGIPYFRHPGGSAAAIAERVPVVPVEVEVHEAGGHVVSPDVGGGGADGG